MEEVKIEEIEEFIHDHIQSKINNDELGMAGFNLNDSEVFKAQYDMFEKGLFEGIINGIIWAGGTVEGIKTE